jgi:hypothetical protein
MAILLNYLKKSSGGGTLSFLKDIEANGSLVFRHLIPLMVGPLVGQSLMSEK